MSIVIIRANSVGLWVYLFRIPRRRVSDTLYVLTALRHDDALPKPPVAT